MMGKVKILALTLCLMMVFIDSAIAKESFSLIKPSSAACDNIAGKWSGNGKVAGNMIGTCYYKGTATFSGSSAINGNISLKRTYGSYYCPPDVDLDVEGICEGDTVTFTFDEYVFSGTTDGKSVHFNGVVMGYSVTLDAAKVS